MRWFFCEKVIIAARWRLRSEMTTLFDSLTSISNNFSFYILRLFMMVSEEANLVSFGPEMASLLDS